MLNFHVSEHLPGQKYESLATSKEVQLGSSLEEKELGYVKVLYGRYAEVYAILDFCSLC